VQHPLPVAGNGGAIANVNAALYHLEAAIAV
jgi:hypothetical protein